MVESIEDQDRYTQSISRAIKIFTDGSKIGGKVGAALTIWTDGTETATVKLALSDYCTVYQAELLALYRATKEAAQHKDTTLGIYSDSMAALQTIQNHRSPTEANERADEVAKEAAVGSKRKPDYDQYPISHVKRCMRSATIDEWNRVRLNALTCKLDVN